MGNLTRSWLERECHPGNYKTCLPEEYRSFGSYVARPMYSVYLRRWLESFDCEGLHVFDVSAEGTKSVGNLYRFMDAEDDRLAKKITASVSHIKTSNATKTGEKDEKKARSNELNKSSYSPMTEGTRKLLRDFYSPYNRELCELVANHACLDVELFRGLCEASS